MTQRIAVVTGGMGGLGLAICRALARAGRRVVAADLPASAERLAEFQARTDGLEIEAAPVDVSDFDACGALVRSVQEKHGALDILVNNAGITRDATLRKMDKPQWDAVLGVHLDGAFHLCRHALDGMQARGFGRIVNITSLSVYVSIPGLDLSSGARAGLTSFLAGVGRTFAARNVTINNLLPGKLATDRIRTTTKFGAEKAGMSVEDYAAKQAKEIPAGRLGTTEEFGAACAFLCSAHAGYITGQNLRIDGGLYPSAF